LSNAIASLEVYPFVCLFWLPLGLYWHPFMGVEKHFMMIRTFIQSNKSISFLIDFLNNQQSAINNQQSTINNRQSAISNQQSSYSKLYSSTLETDLFIALLHFTYLD
jgi:hypothetical protein